MRFVHRKIIGTGWEKAFLFLILLWCNTLLSQQTITGHIIDDSGESLGDATIINMTTDKKIYSNSLGMFSIEAFPNDELRFVKEGFRRVSKRVLTDGINSQLLITLFPIPKEIEEVKIIKQLTGDLEQDSRAVAKMDKGEQVRQAVGLPQPVGKMREKPAEVKSVLLPVLFGSLNVQGVYDLVSGKARRQKRQYKYDDLQENIIWVRNRVEDEYFTKAGIPANRISEFIDFSFTIKPQTRTYVKARNLSGVLLKLEETMPLYIERLNQSSK